MAITNWNNFIAAGTQESPLTNLLENAFKGYQMGRAPAQMDEEQKQRQLGIQLKQMEAEHKPTEYKLSDEQKKLANAIQSEAYKHLPEKYKQELALNQARINKLNQTANPADVVRNKEEQKANVKRQQEILQLAPHLLATGRDVAGIQDLLGGEDKPTGVYQALKNKVGLGSEKLGEFNEKALRLQADLARLISSRGGAVAAGIAARGKPSEWSNKAYNLGITKSMQGRIEREFKGLQEEYKRVSNGQELPYSLNDIFHEATQQASQGSSESGSNDLVYNPTTGRLE